MVSEQVYYPVDLYYFSLPKILVSKKKKYRRFKFKGNMIVPAHLRSLQGMHDLKGLSCVRFEEFHYDAGFTKFNVIIIFIMVVSYY